MAEASDVMIAYRTYPHVDQRSTGARVGELVIRALRGAVQPVVCVAARPFLIPPDGSDTSKAPMKQWLDAAREMEHRPGVLSASCCATQPWLDIANLGSHAIIVVDRQRVDVTQAQQWAKALVEVGWNLRDRFIPRRWTPQEAVRAALEESAGLVVLADLGDGTAGGGAGDSAVLLEQLLAASPKIPCAVPLVDPPAVHQCWSAGVGHSVQLTVGGQFHSSWYRPVNLSGHVERLWSGNIQLEGPYFRGRILSIGRIAVVRHLGLSVLLLERPTLTSDPALFRAVGLPPEEARVIVVKSPLLFRAAFEPLAQRVLLVDTPGPTDHHFSRLPYQRVQGRVDGLQETPH
jgi:microcystin degradation protein MlrC